MGKYIDDLRKQAKSYTDEIDVEGLINQIDFSKVDAKRLKKIDFNKGLENARHQLEQLPKVRVTTQPEKDEGGFVGGLILGVVLGAIIALLFAPKSGEDTRELVASTVDDLKDKMAGDDADIREEMVETLDAASDTAGEKLPDEPAIERNFGE